MNKVHHISERIIDSNGDIRWKAIISGMHVTHREDGPAVIEKADGTEWWMINGQLHREDGPAIYRKIDGLAKFYIDGHMLNPEMTINNSELQRKYPKLVAMMLIYLVYNS